MTKPFAVITARSGSRRLPWKNMLPINGKSIAETAIDHAVLSGLYPVVTSDIDAVLNYTTKVGGLAIRRPSQLVDGSRHIDSIRHAVECAVAADPSKLGAPVVLLQPTSPFRMGGIIKKCIDAHLANRDKVVYSGRAINGADVLGRKISTLVWDGCVAVYPHNSIGPTPESIVVENEHGNMLQIDTEEDYIQACIHNWRIGGHWLPLDNQEAAACAAALKPIVEGMNVSVVGRPDGLPIDQSNPVVYLNHCSGYDGGRADILVVVASKNIVKVGINKELEEVALKAKAVIIRDFGQGDWVLSNLKTTCTPILSRSSKNQITTGAFASALVYVSGGVANRVGFQRGVSRIPYCYACFNEPRASDEIALLEVSGTDRRG